MGYTSPVNFLFYFSFSTPFFLLLHSFYFFSIYQKKSQDDCWLERSTFYTRFFFVSFFPSLCSLPARSASMQFSSFFLCVLGLLIVRSERDLGYVLQPLMESLAASFFFPTSLVNIAVLVPDISNHGRPCQTKVTCQEVKSILQQTRKQRERINMLDFGLLGYPVPL